jgi:nicotinamidase/pyrazinamidase
VNYDDKTALLVVDVQNDFADPRGSLYVNEGEAVVDVINREIERAKSAGALVVYTQDWHPEATPHFVDQGGKWPRHCVRGSWGAELVEGLRVQGPIVRKGTGGEDGYSGFSVREPVSGKVGLTELDEMLKQRDIERIVVVGLAQDVCVKETALDGKRLGYATTVVKAATRPIDALAGDQVLGELSCQGIGVA